MNRSALAVLLFLLLSGCRMPSQPSSPMAAPYAVLLGTAQDAGLPQIGCQEHACVAARNDPARRRLASSLLLTDPRSGNRWLFDATPDLREQVERARSHPPGRPDGPGRPPLFEGVFLTHAHMGHYTGLVHLGNEGYGARDLELYVTPRMAGFLRGNDPWRWMIGNGFLQLTLLEYEAPVELAPDLTVTAIPVPHREEFSDTVAFVIRGPDRSLLFLPDIDKWERWPRRIEEVIASVDAAFVDGTFYADGEIPGRAMAQIPHPFITESMDRFASLPASERSKIHFTHLNHTNPAADPRSAAARAIRQAGFHVATESQRIDL